MLNKEQEEILKLLRKFWKKYPNQRFGQFLENYLFFQGQRGDKTSNMLFFQEDKETLDILRHLGNKK